MLEIRPLQKTDGLLVSDCYALLLLDNEKLFEVKYLR